MKMPMLSAALAVLLAAPCRGLSVESRPTATRTWSGVPQAPADPILGVAEAFRADASPDKINLGIGAYRDDGGAPWVLPSVRAAEGKLHEQACDHEYLGMAGLPAFVGAALRFAYGSECAALAAGRVAAIQTLSGTGACRAAGVFLERFSSADTVYVSAPTWGNHIPIFEEAGLKVERYRYFDAATNGLDFAGMLADVEAAPDGSVFLLHACAHNPTGVDPSDEQWAALSGALRRHVVMFDCAYQGFASGDATRDAHAIRQFVADGHSIMLSQSYAKNFGLYGERIGALSVVCADADEKARVESQLKILVRPMYSNPPVYGARIVAEVLGDPALRAQWTAECKAMADRIIEMRAALRSQLGAAGSKREWSHITSQIGMFAFTGLTEPEVLELRSKYHIYLTNDGRISMAGVTTGNVEYLASSIAAVAG